MDRLPNDVIIHDIILQIDNYDDLVSLCKSNKRLHTLCKTNNIVKRHLQKLEQDKYIPTVILSVSKQYKEYMNIYVTIDIITNDTTIDYGINLTYNTETKKIGERKSINNFINNNDSLLLDETPDMIIKDNKINILFNDYLHAYKVQLHDEKYTKYIKQLFKYLLTLDYSKFEIDKDIIIFENKRRQL